MKFIQKPSEANPISLANPAAFASFYEQTHLNVFRYVIVLCAGNQDEAEDITADAYLRAWQKRQGFHGSAGAALGWVITIARNRLIDRRRAEKGGFLVPKVDETVSDQSVPIENLLVEGERFQEVLAAVHSLPFQQSNIFTLRYALGWRVKDIAEHLGIAENTVSVDLRRAAAKLQNQLSLSEFVKR